MAQTTKEAIAASLKRLLTQKPLSKITVTDIAKECKVSRHTFYYHFRDVYDLMEWIYRSQEAELQESGKADWRQGMVELFRRLQEMGCPAEFYAVDGQGHGFFQGDEPYRLIHDFFDKYLLVR